MKKIEIKIEGLSPKVRNKCVTYARKHGYQWGIKPRKGDRYIDFCVDKEAGPIIYGAYCKGEAPNWVLLNPEIPAEYETFKRLIRESVEKVEKVEPKDGEVFVSTSGNHSDGDIFRYRKTEHNKMYFYSALEKIGGKLDTSKYFFYGWESSNTRRKATREEEAKLIEAEHKNGWHWTGKELVRIPEYIEVTNEHTASHVWHYSLRGEIFPVLEFHPESDEMVAEYKVGDDKYVTVDNSKPSTSEAYEAQEAKKSKIPEAGPQSCTNYDKRPEPKPIVVKGHKIDESKTQLSTFKRLKGGKLFFTIETPADRHDIYTRVEKLKDEILKRFNSVLDECLAGESHTTPGAAFDARELKRLEKENKKLRQIAKSKDYIDRGFLDHVDAMEKENKELKERLEAAMERNGEYIAEIAELKETISSIPEDNAVNIDRINELMIQVCNLHSKLANIKAERDALVMAMRVLINE